MTRELAGELFLIAMADPEVEHVAQLEELIHAADAAGEGKVAFEARVQYLFKMMKTDVDKPMEALGALLHALAWWDAHPAEPDGWDRHVALWMVKGRVQDLANHPEVPVAKVEELLADYDRRLESSGFSKRAAYAARMDLQLARFDLDAADAEMGRMLREPHDQISNCPGCEITDIVDLQARRGEYADAVRSGQDFLGSGDRACERQPHDLLAQMLVPMAELGRAEEAVPMYRRVSRKIAKDPGRRWAAHRLIVFLARVGHAERAAALVEQWVAWREAGESTPTPGELRADLVDEAYALERAVAAGLGDRPFRGGTIAEAADDLRQQAAVLSARFDARLDEPRATRDVEARLAAPELGHVALR